MTGLLTDWRPGGSRMVYMVIYQEADGLWHIWASPLAEWELESAVQACIRAYGDVPIEKVFAPTVEDLAEYVKTKNDEATILMPPAQELCPFEFHEGLLPEPRPWHSLSMEDRRRIEMEKGPASDHDTAVRYHPTDEDLIKWAVLVAKYHRGELES